MKNILLMALLASTAAVPAAANPETEQLRIVVDYTAADLATPAARASLEKRVRRAIRKACDVPGPRSTDAVSRISACIDQAWNDAAPKVDLALSSAASPGRPYSG